MQIDPALLLSPNLVLRLLIGFAVGGLIGLERQKRMIEESTVGVRSFGLHSLLGTLSAYTFTVTGNNIVLVYGTAISIVIVSLHVTYKILRTMRKGLTTSLVFAMSFVLGALVGLDTPPEGQLVGTLQVLAMTVAFLVFLVLGFKEDIAAAVAVVTRDEMISAAELGVLILFFWPLIPQSIELAGVTFPLFQTYALVVLLLAISFANYILVKKYKNRGVYFFGFFGGFANSEATVSSLADFYVKTDREHPGRISLSTILANLAMVLRNGVIVVLLDPTLQIIRFYLVPILILLIIGAFRLVYESRIRKEPQEFEIDTKFVSPFEFGAALRFAAVFTFVTYVSLLLQQYFSDVGIIIAAVFGGFVSAGAVVAIVAPALATGSITLSTAVYAVIIATTTSVFNKVLYVYTATREEKLLKIVGRDSLLMGISVIVYLLLLFMGIFPV